MTLVMHETLRSDGDDEYARQGAEAAELVANNPSLDDLSTLDREERLGDVRGYDFVTPVGLIDYPRPEGEAATAAERAPETEADRQRRKFELLDEIRTRRVLGGVAFRGRLDTITHRSLDGMPQKPMPKILGKASLRRFDLRY